MHHINLQFISNRSAPHGCYNYLKYIYKNVLWTMKSLLTSSTINSSNRPSWSIPFTCLTKNQNRWISNPAVNSHVGVPLPSPPRHNLVYTHPQQNIQEQEHLLQQWSKKLKRANMELFSSLPQCLDDFKCRSLENEFSLVAMKLPRTSVSDLRCRNELLARRTA